MPSPEGAAPAKVIEQTVAHLNKDQFDVLSNHNEKLQKETYDASVFHFVEANFIDKFLLNGLKIFWNYTKRKQLLITAQDSQLLYFIAVCRFVRKHNYQKIIVHVAPGLITMLHKVFPKKDFIFYHHGTSLHRKLNAIQWELLLKSTNNRIIGVNQKALTRANEVFEFQLDAENYVTVPNGIQKLTTKIALISEIDTSKFSILFSGRICKEKGVLELIKAFEIVHAKNKQTQLIILGGAGTKRNIASGTTYLEICKNYCASKQLDVLFTGFQPQEKVYSYVNAVNLVVLPTNPLLSEEGMSLALLEAMSFGKPLIATDSGGNAEIVIDGFNGFVIPESETYATIMATKIETLISSTTLQTQFAENSKVLFQEKHTSQAMASNFLKALKHFNFL